MNKQRNIPASALHLNVGAFELAESQSDDASSIPIRMVARSGQPIDHWFWGRIVHDLSGMTLHKQRVTVDYCHDSDQVLGYLDKFETESGNLVATGFLVAHGESDRASEVLHKAKSGVPYEASINFGGNGIHIEEVAEGQNAEVNGYELAGPAVIVRKWPLRGVAVCPYGADMNTSSQFTESDKVLVTVNASEPIDQTVDGSASDEVDAGNASADELQRGDAALGQRFLDSFGEKGGVWFAQGKTYHEAQQLFIQELQRDNEELRRRLGASDRGHDEPVEFQAETTDDDAEMALRREELTRCIGASLGSFAAGLRFKNRQ